MRTEHTGCGGTILCGGEGPAAHIYCDRCGAFARTDSEDLPTGRDGATNRIAWDAGERRSPPAGFRYADSAYADDE